MSNDPYQSPQAYSNAPPPPSEQNPTSLILGIISIVLGLLSFFPGCCCGYFAIPGTLISLGCGVGGLLTAGDNQAGKICSIVGLVINGLVLLLWIVLIILALAGHAIDPAQFQDLQNEF